MQEVFREQIMPDVFLTCVRTDKFKTGCLSVNLITPLSRDTAAKNALLPKVLLRGTAAHPDMESITSALDSLYGARIVPMVRKKGECHCIGLLADFVDDDFVPRGETVMERMCAFVGELLFAPRTSGGLLYSDYVEGEKKNLVDEIRAAVNDKRTYAVDRLFELMCADEPFGVGRLGTEDAASEITPASLTRQYRSLLVSSRVEAFYCGAQETPAVKAAVLEALSPLPRGGKPAAVSTDVRLTPPPGSPKTVTEKLEVTQGKLSAGFRIGRAMLSPNYAALMVFNAVYGGSITSKLFLNVRERLSLCYYASSTVEKHKGVMAVTSGVDFKKFDEALAEILRQLEAVKKGDISDWELTSAKRAVITGLKSAMDRPSGLEELFLDNAVASISFTPDELAALVDSVTLSDVTGIASDVQLDTVYFLTGAESGGETA